MRWYRPLGNAKPGIANHGVRKAKVGLRSVEAHSPSDDMIESGCLKAQKMIFAHFISLRTLHSRI